MLIEQEIEKNKEVFKTVSFREYEFSREELARIKMTISCQDSSLIPKVPDAGRIFVENDLRIQLMHNGVRVIADGYGGKWNTKIIELLQGCHEPQEEWVYHHIVERLKKDTANPIMLELGAHWSFYSLWLLKEIAGTDCYMVEPDPNNLKVGQLNFSLNKCHGNFLQAGIGKFSPSYQPFQCEDGITRQLPAEDLPSLFRRFCFEHLDLLLLDIQGAETSLIESGKELFKNNKIRFVIVSTHHHLISGDLLTHQRCLDMLTSWGAHIIAEHSVLESYSGDGLIAASFDPRDQDLVVKIAYARAKESLFGEGELYFQKIKVDLEGQLENCKQEITNLKLKLPEFARTPSQLLQTTFRNLKIGLKRALKGSYKKLFLS